MKKMVSTILLVILVFASISFSYAETGVGLTKNGTVEKKRAENGTKVTTVEEFENLKAQNFTSYIGFFFENPSVYHAINMEGEDISKEYYDENVALYESRDYKKLMENTDKIISSFDKYVIDNNIDEQAINRAIVSKSISKTFCCLYTNAFTNNEAAIALLGRYNVDRADGNVLSASRPTIELLGYEHPDLQGFTMQVISTDYRITGGGTAVDFTGVIDLYGVFGNDSVYYGRYVMSIRGSGDGYISCTPSDGYVYPQ